MDYTGKSYEEIEGVVDNLLNIDSDNLDAEAIRNQRIFTEINRIYIHKSREYVGLTNQLANLEHKQFRHYAGKLTAEHYKKNPLPEAILKTDIPSWMAVDPLVVEMRGLVKECERVVKYLEDAKGSLRSRGFDIKNAIEYRKLMMGG